MTESAELLPKEEGIQKAVKAIRKIVGTDPIVSDDGIQGLYRQIMGEESDVSMTSFRIAVRKLTHGHGNRPFRIEQGPRIDGQARRAELSKVRSGRRGARN